MKPIPPKAKKELHETKLANGDMLPDYYRWMQDSKWPKEVTNKEAIKQGADLHHTAMDGWNVLHFTINAKDPTGSSQYACLKELVEVSDKDMWGYSAKIYPGTSWAGHLFPAAQAGETHTALEFFDAFVAQNPDGGYNGLLENAHNIAGIPLAGADGAGAADSFLYE